jgi:hypothetical protein
MAVDYGALGGVVAAAGFAQPVSGERLDQAAMGVHLKTIPRFVP